MSDIESPYEAQDSQSDPDPYLPPAHPIDAAPEVRMLATSVRRLRIWLAVLTVVVVFALIGACGLVGMAVYAVTGLTSGAGMSVSESELDSVRADFEEGYGDRIESLDVRAVKIEYGGPMEPFPFSFLTGSGEESAYVECRLAGPNVVIADLVGGMYGMDAISSGMIPTKGSLTGQMTEEQLDAVLAAYAAETQKPLGGVRRYTELDEMMYDGSPVAETVNVGGEEYATAELWAAVEGRLIEGDTYETGAGSDYMRDAVIFHEDPETGAFTFLGTEQTSSMW